MNLCYRLETILFDKGFLDDSTDCTYILHLEGNGRYNRIKEQLNKYQPTKKVYILHNKGYKNCKKEEFINKPPYDLIDAFLYIFKDANKKNYNNVLILEDDFIFDDKINNKNNTDKINKFINKHNNKEIMYSLGVLPFILIPKEYSHYKVILSVGSHSIIYNRNIRNKILKIKQQDIKDWDIHKYFRYNLYTYHEPLCYQIFPETENQKHWGNSKIIREPTILFLKFLELDKKPKPGYHIMYFLSKVIILIVILFIIYYLIK
jgi:hypothetical protein